MSAPISAAVWRRIFDGYVDTGTIQGAAKFAGVDQNTAAKYIKIGDAKQGLDSIEAMLKEQNKIAVDKYNESRQKELEAYRSLGSRQLMRVAQALQKADIELSGVTRPDGTIGISPKEYLRLHTLAKSNFGFSNDVHDEINGGSSRRNVNEERGSVVNVNVGVQTNTTNKTPLNEWREIEKRYLTNEELSLTASERAQLLAAKTSGASVQGGTPDDEEELLIIAPHKKARHRHKKIIAS